MAALPWIGKFEEFIAFAERIQWIQQEQEHDSNNSLVSPLRSFHWTSQRDPLVPDLESIQILCHQLQLQGILHEWAINERWMMNYTTLIHPSATLQSQSDWPLRCWKWRIEVQWSAPSSTDGTQTPNSTISGSWSTASLSSTASSTNSNESSVLRLSRGILRVEGALARLEWSHPDSPASTLASSLSQSSLASQTLFAWGITQFTASHITSSSSSCHSPLLPYRCLFFNYTPESSESGSSASASASATLSSSMKWRSDAVELELQWSKPSSSASASVHSQSNSRFKSSSRDLQMKDLNQEFEDSDDEVDNENDDEDDDGGDLQAHKDIGSRVLSGRIVWTRTSQPIGSNPYSNHSGSQSNSFSLSPGQSPSSSMYLDEPNGTRSMIRQGIMTLQWIPNEEE